MFRPNDKTSPKRTLRAMPDATLSLITWLTLLCALWTMGRMIAPGAWQLQTAIVAACVLGSAAIVRATTRRDPLALVASILVALGSLTVMFLPNSAFLSVIPTQETFVQARRLFDTSVQLFRDGAAPIEAPVPVAFTMCLGVALLAVALDVFVLIAGLPLVGGLTIMAFIAVPSFILPSLDDLLPATWAVIGIALMLFRDGTRKRRHQQLPRASARSTVVSAAAATVAIAVTVGLAPGMTPTGSSAQVPGFGSGPSIDASIDLGRDLRQPRETELFRYTSDAPGGANMRLATLSSFDDDVWVADDTVLADMGWLDSARPEVVNPEIEVREFRMSVAIGNMQSDLLPLPATVRTTTNLSDGWGIHPDSRTAAATQPGRSVAGLRYDVMFTRPSPTAEQMRAARAVMPVGSPGILTLPRGVPNSVRELAHEVTQSATTDYDKAVALQTWFRSSFQYSLDAPASDGYDNTSMQSLDAFLELRSGYCVHFATAFTLMARELGIPTRIVLGTLPGERTGAQVDGLNEYAVTTSKLHTWPEVFFEGIGWVPFEPTATLGSATMFASESSGAQDPEPTAAPTTAPNRNPLEDFETLPTASPGTDTAGAFDVWRLVIPLSLVGALVLVAGVPRFIRGFQRRVRRRGAATGGASAAWREAQAQLVDAGYDLDASETPREFATRIDAGGLVTQQQLAPLVAAIEQRSYGPATLADGAQLIAALDAVHASTHGLGGTKERIKRALLPRSVFTPRGKPENARRPESLARRS